LDNGTLNKLTVGFGVDLPSLAAVGITSEIKISEVVRNLPILDPIITLDYGATEEDISIAGTGSILIDDNPTVQEDVAITLDATGVDVPNLTAVNKTVVYGQYNGSSGDVSTDSSDYDYKRIYKSGATNKNIISFNDVVINISTRYADNSGDYQLAKSYAKSGFVRYLIYDEFDNLLNPDTFETDAKEYVVGDYTFYDSEGVYLASNLRDDIDDARSDGNPRDFDSYNIKFTTILLYSRRKINYVLV
jgi:hypothetical protein